MTIDRTYPIFTVRWLVVHGLAVPTDLLYIFPVVILGTITCNVGLAVLEPSMIGEPLDPFATPLEILP